MSENNISKKLKKGFTLIELIVVMAIMGFLFVAILNLMDPIQNVYHTAVGTQDTAETIEGVMTYADNQLRFASNVCVLKDFDGVPRVEGKSLFINGVKQSVEYDNVLILDNNNDRSKSHNEVAKRKGATGAVLRTDLSSGLDLDNANLAPTNDYYGEVRYEFDAEVNYSDADTSKVYIDLGVTAYSYHLEDTTYVFDQKLQSYARRIELVNIGINKGDQYKLDDYAAGNASQMQAGNFYDSQGTDKSKRTYIFYKNPTVNDSAETEYSVTLEYHGTGIYSEQRTVNVKNGKKATNVVEPSDLKSIAIAGKMYVIGTPVDWKLEGSTETYNISKIKDMTITGNMVFQAQYAETDLKQITVQCPSKSVSFLKDSHNGQFINYTAETFNAESGVNAIDPEKEYVSAVTYDDGGSCVTDSTTVVTVEVKDKLEGKFILHTPSSGDKEKTIYFEPGSPIPPSDEGDFTTSVSGYIFNGWKVGTDTFEDWKKKGATSNFTAEGDFTPDSTHTTVKLVLNVSNESKGLINGNIIIVPEGTKLSGVKINGTDESLSSSNEYYFQKAYTLNDSKVEIEATQENTGGELKIFLRDGSYNELASVSSNINNTSVERWIYNNNFYEDEDEMNAVKYNTPYLSFSRQEDVVDTDAGIRYIHYTLKNTGGAAIQPYCEFEFDKNIEHGFHAAKVMQNSFATSYVDGNKFNFNLPSNMMPGYEYTGDDFTFGVKSLEGDISDCNLRHVRIYYIDGEGQHDLINQDV